MKIKQVFNNNIVAALDNHQNELVLMGKGLGFMKQSGEDVVDEKIEKVFTNENQNTSSRLNAILEEIPEHIIDISDEIIKLAKSTLGKKLNDIIYVSLTDHIHYALERYKAGMNIKNGLLWEISRLYYDEYLIGRKALEIIETNTSICLPEDEAAFIAQHIINAELNEEMTNIVNITKATKEILNIVKYNFNVHFDTSNLAHHRFVTHLKFFAQRLFNGIHTEDKDKSLYPIVKEIYKDAFKCTEKISEFVEKRYRYTLSQDEKLYLTIHIDHVVSQKCTAN